MATFPSGEDGSPRTERGITLYVERGGVFWPLYFRPLASLETDGFVCQRFMLLYTGQHDQSNESEPSGNRVTTPHAACPEQDLNSGGDGSPDLVILDSSVTDTVLLSVGQSNASGETVMGAPFNEQ